MNEAAGCSSASAASCSIKDLFMYPPTLHKYEVAEIPVDALFGRLTERLRDPEFLERLKKEDPLQDQLMHAVNAANRLAWSCGWDLTKNRPIPLPGDSNG